MGDSDDRRPSSGRRETGPRPGTGRQPGARRQPGTGSQAGRRPQGGAATGRATASAHRPASRRRRALSIGRPQVRQQAITLGALGILTVFAARLVMIQGIDPDDLATQALESRLATSTVTTDRADIVDRNGEVLATSVNRYHVWVNQQKLADFKRVEDGTVVAEGALDAAAILAPILDLDESELAAKLVGDDTFVYIAKYVTPETWSLISDEGIYGVEPEAVSERIYPNGDLAGNLVGFVGGAADKQGVNWGLAGMEKSQEDSLLGTDGSLTYERGGNGTAIPTGVLEETPAEPGQDVVLTIDRDIQYYAQSRLEEALSVTGASHGFVTVEDTRTGEVYALADSGTVDPNDPGATDNESRSSRAIEDVFEPGSTAKAITMAAAIEEGVITPGSRFEVPYEYTTSNGQTFKDSHEHGLEKMTAAGILVDSSNTGTVMIGEQLSTEQRYEYLKAFGFGEATGIGMPSESSGILSHWENWDGRSKYAVLYGQAVAVTALQTSQVYQTLANGGERVSPSLIKGYRNADGTVTPREQSEPVRVVSEETADQVMLMLEDVTEEGTGTLAKIDGYRVAGKTGTAQAVGSSGKLDSIVASFVGVAPADDPAIVVSVSLFDPKSSIWGGEVAAPVFSDVATFALQTLRVPPSGPAEELYPTTWE
ncbi:penicillin-binding protein 2 [Demequina sp. NBRC 110055]|uniref:peptidoglycan D,D-transpeptidase FtsI family protein n=1 Tax=Demequina sp. NBRC 110055 TaxID=1570344 RepID=UPI000A07BCD9|nr:penicillin-binding protein 2 [Demequina sp. NBRC 110055]